MKGHICKLFLFLIISFVAYMYYKIKQTTYEFHEVDPTGEAKCLNGQNYGIHFSQSPSNKYLLSFEGGGW